MARKKNNTRDSGYFLKLVLYVIVGSQWLWVAQSDGDYFPVPLGLVIGLVFASHDHFQLDRKIEYAVLLVAGLIAFWAQLGIFVRL